MVLTKAAITIVVTILRGMAIGVGDLFGWQESKEIKGN